MEADLDRARATLEIACRQYGDLNWDQTTPLQMVIQDHLLAPLQRTLDRVSRHTETLRERARTAEIGLAALQAKTAAASQSEISPASRTRERDPEPRPPVPLRPTPVPAPAHKIVVVRAQLRELLGHRGVCLCGWKTAVEVGDRSADLAALAGDRHCQRYEITRGETRDGTR